MGTLVPFAKFVSICVLGIFLQEVWLNSIGLLEAFDIIICNLPKLIVAGKAAGFIIEGGTNMIEYLKHYLTATGKNKTRRKAKDLSEWMN